jgi:lambda repressor-like predicted transcriptional regulator
MRSLTPVKNFCRENNVTLRIFVTEAKRLGVELELVNHEDTGGQLSFCCTKRNANKILESIKESFTIRKNERTLADLAKEYGIKVGTLRGILKRSGIPFRMVRAWQTSKNSHKRNQNTLAFKVSDAKKILDSVKESLTLHKNERTLENLAKEYKLNIGTLRGILKRSGIQSRNVRSWQNSKNRHKRNQNTLAFKISEVKKALEA